MQSEDVYLLVSVERAQLDSRNHTNPHRVSSFDGFGYSSHRVVIGERDRGKTCGSRSGNNLRWRQRAVRRGRMHVQIDLGLLCGRGCHCV